MCWSACRQPYQFSGSHLEQNLLSVLAVMAALHDGQQKLGGIVLQKKCATLAFCVSRMEINPSNALDEHVESDSSKGTLNWKM